MHAIKVLDTPIGTSEIRINDALRALSHARVISAFPAPTPQHMIVVIEYTTEGDTPHSAEHSPWRGGGLTKN